ncbi:MAG: spermidine/putrescine ABC transporter substrate-binding protein [Defluviitaleaceae bacterium]|nr:spermidine/putrescine ABC transporter substrate-binding protein [Defluviitaleaceae bacterium]
MKRFFSLFLTAVMVFALAGCRTAGDTLIIYTWEDYVPQAVIDDFERDTGIRVVYASFSSNEEMFNSFVQKVNQYDLILCSDYMIERMIGMGGLLQQIDSSRIENFGNISPLFQNQYFDPDNKYAIPYSTGSPIIVYDSARVPVPITRIRDLWDPSLRESVVLLDDVRDIMGMTLLMLGESVNETDPEILDRVRQELIALKPNVIAFNADYPHRSIINGDASVGYMYGSQATAAWEAVPTVKFVFPEEGVSTFIDGFVLSAEAPNTDNAYIFLNYILDGEVSAKMSGIINYGNCNTAAKEFLPESFRNNLSVNIPDEVQATAQLFKPIGEAEILYDIIWTEFKAAN